MSIHPAPYRDPVLAMVHRRGLIKLQVFTMFERDSGHLNWNLEEPPYPNVFLGKSVRVRDYMHWHPRILPYLWRGKFDAILVPGYSHITSQLAILFSLITHTPMIYSADSVLFASSKHFGGIWRERLLKFVLGHAGAVWVPGQASRRWVSTFGVKPQRVFEGAYTLDYQAIRNQMSDANDLRNSVRNDLGIDRKQFVFLMVATMIPNRCHQLLIKAFAQVNASEPGTHLILIGAGPERANIDIICAEVGCLNISIIDSVPFDDLPRWYAACDAYIHSGNEPYSTAVAYAAIAGRPVIVSDLVGAGLDYVVDQETGYVVSDSSPEGFARPMFELARNPDLARRMGERIRPVAMRRSVQWAACQLEMAVMAAVRGAIGSCLEQ